MSNPELLATEPIDAPEPEIASRDVDEITETQRMLAEVAAAEVKVDYVPTTEEAKCDIFLSLPHDCTMDGHFAHLADGELYANIGDWEVNKKLRRNGIGRRLLGEFRKQALSHGVTHIHACVVSSEALRGVSLFFGFDNLELQGIDADKFKGMSLQQLLDLMESGAKRGYALKIKIK